jgi:hypothetical protein
LEIAGICSSEQIFRRLFPSASSAEKLKFIRIAEVGRATDEDAWQAIGGEAFCHVVAGGSFALNLNRLTLIPLPYAGFFLSVLRVA